MKMEPVRKCPTCGWALPWNSPAKTCGICHSTVKITKCGSCGAYVPPDTRKMAGRTLCDACYKALKRKEQLDLFKRIDDRYTEWLDLVSKVPKPYRTITDEQWLNACRYFGGCALCDEEFIEARGFFLPFKAGGRYCDWNVIPLCRRCATTTKLQPSIWKRIGYTQMQRINWITAYLRPIMEERINEAGKTESI